MIHIPLSSSLTSVVEDAVSSIGTTIYPLGLGVVGSLVALISSRVEDMIGEVVSDIKLGVKEVGLTVPTPVSDGGADSEGLVKVDDDFVMQSSLLT